jgi:NAD(P)H-hydrate repair Nnr-like enzyme with NAD(P)H-hydrate dehydratase domain
MDASALFWIPAGPTPPGAIRVITPHPGEAARLLETSVTEVQHQRTQALQELSRRWGQCWVVLKGHLTLTGRAKGSLRVNNSGNPHLAQGGSGDLLAGYLAACLAQPDLQTDPARTIQYAVWKHGHAADQLNRHHPNWTVEDLAVVLGQS